MITECRSCQSEQLRPILSLGDQYLSDFIDAKDKGKKPPQFPLDLVLCEPCSLLQLTESAPPALLYPDSYGYRSGINQTMRDHLAGVVREVAEIADVREGDTVVDIGSNDGTLLKAYPSTVHRVGYDLLRKFEGEYDQPNLEVRIGGFDGHDEPAKVITAISCFYDLEDPNRFLEAVKASLAPDGVFVVQQNYLGGMIRQTAFDNICHEHLEYYSLSAMEALLDRHGLEVFRVTENGLNGGSFRTYIRRATGQGNGYGVEEMRLAERSLGLQDTATYEKFSQRAQETRDKLRELVLRETEAGKRVYVYGASTRGNTILQYCDFGPEHIAGAAERNPEKWGKVIASSGIPIVSEAEARQAKPEYMMALPWFFRDEFVERERDYLEAGGSLIFPLPEPCIVTSRGVRML